MNKSFEKLIQKEMKKWHVPGLAITIVKKDKVIYSGGFGYRNIKKKLPVTPETRFAIASNTKAFTAMGVALLVADGLLDWDTPIKNYIPQFKLADPIATERITARDLLCHRSGLPRHDAMWYLSKDDRKTLVERLHGLQPGKDFRTNWQYQNMMYVTAGYLIEQITGQTWEQFTQTRILDVLDMKHSNLSIDDMPDNKNYALPYEYRDGKYNKRAFCNLDNAGPAGSMNSTVEDMSLWLKALLNQGKYAKGKRLLPKSIFKELFTPQMIVDDPDRNELIQSEFITYGLGWFIQSYHGHTMVSHGGAIDGFSCRTALIPEEQIGITVLTNLEDTPLPVIVVLSALDQLLGLKPVAWSDKSAKIRAKELLSDQKERDEMNAKQIPITAPSHPPKAYSGTYENAGYGKLKVSHKKDRLSIVYNSRKWPLAHYHYDLFEAHQVEQLNETWKQVTFFTGLDGKIEALSINLQDGVEPIHFKRI